MKRFPIRLLTLVSLIVAIFVAATLARCAAPQESETEEDAGVTVHGEVHAAAAEVVEEEDPFSLRDLDQYIVVSLPEEWPELEDDRVKGLSLNVWAHANLREVDARLVTDELVDLTAVLFKMQPAFARGREGGTDRAIHIAWDIYEETHKAIGTCDVAGADALDDLNVYLVASMGKRESDFLQRTEQGFTKRQGQVDRNCRWCRGALGERGMFQIMPRSPAERLMGRGCDPFDRRCNVRGAVRYLASVRCACIEEWGHRTTIASWMASYGSRTLVSPDRARHHKSVRNARRYLCDAVEDCDMHWPQDHDDDFALSL